MENSDVQSSPAGGHFAAVVLALDGDFGTGKRSGNPHWLAGRPLEDFAVRSALLSRRKFTRKPVALMYYWNIAHAQALSYAG